VAFIPSGLRAGDLLDFAYVLTSRRQPSAWDWYETDDYGAHVCDRRLVVDVPEAIPLRSAAHGFDPPIEERGGGRKHPHPWTFDAQCRQRCRPRERYHRHQTGPGG